MFYPILLAMHPPVGTFARFPSWRTSCITVSGRAASKWRSIQGSLNNQDPRQNQMGTWGAT